MEMDIFTNFFGTFSNLLIASSIALIALLVIYYLIVPINLVKDLSEPSQDHVQRSPVVPPVFPNGWIPVEESQNVTSTSVTRARLYIHDIILIRPDSMKNIRPDGMESIRPDSMKSIQAFDAFCPHLGAHLGYNSEVVKSSANGQSCLRCPFHGWEFDTKDGKCSKVPYSKGGHGPSGVRLKQWPVFESSGFVFIWFHAEGIDPTWYPPLIPEIVSNEWTYGGRTQDTVNCHLQEIPENGADVGHLESLHSPSIVCGGHFIGWWRKQFSFFLLGQHIWNAEWKGPGHFESSIHGFKNSRESINGVPKNGGESTNGVPKNGIGRMNDKTMTSENVKETGDKEPNLNGSKEGESTLNGGQDKTNLGHINNIILRHRLCLFGMTIYNLYLEIQQIGPSFVVLRFKSDDWGGSRGAYIQAVTPMASNKQRIIHHIYQDQGFTGLLLSRFMLWSQSNMLERDVQIWQRKRYLKAPALIKEEKSIAQFRSWFGQFYSENSPRSFSSLLDW